MPGIADQLITPQAKGMFGNHRAIGHDPHTVGRAAHRDGAAAKCRWQTVAIAIEGDQADAGRAQDMFEIAIELRGDRPVRRLLLGKPRGNYALRTPSDEVQRLQQCEPGRQTNCK